MLAFVKAINLNFCDISREIDLTTLLKIFLAGEKGKRNKFLGITFVGGTSRQKKHLVIVYITLIVR